MKFNRYITKWIHNFMKSEGPENFATGEGGFQSKQRFWNCSDGPAKMFGIEHLAAITSDLSEFGTVECDAPDYYYTNEETMDEWLANALNDKKVPYSQYSVDDKKLLIKTLANRQQADGEMITSAAPLDPLFWVQHGAADRLWQRMEMNAIFSDAPFDVVSGCAGHSADGKLGWLKGYSVNDPMLQMDNVTVADLVGMLNPMTPGFVENFDFIYETTDYEWCPGLVDIV